MEIVERRGIPAVGLISDFFHMHSEETSTPEALRAAGRHVRHLHLADNMRLEPGTGDIDFTGAFKALKEMEFTGCTAYECGISGPDREASLIRSLEYVVARITQACLGRRCIQGRLRAVLSSANVIGMRARIVVRERRDRIVRPHGPS